MKKIIYIFDYLRNTVDSQKFTKSLKQQILDQHLCKIVFNWKHF